jgi:hypothetical protein
MHWKTLRTEERVGMKYKSKDGREKNWTGDRIAYSA